MALEYATNTLTWHEDSDQWKLSMRVSPGQAGVSVFPFVVERFISEDDLLKDDGTLKTLAEVKEELDDSTKYLFRRVATLDDLQTTPSKDALATDLRGKQDGRMEDTSVGDDSEYTAEMGPAFSFEDYTYPSAITASSHYDHIPISGYYKFRVEEISASYSTYDLGATIQEANDSYLRVYAGDFLEDSAASTLPLSVGISGVHPSRTFTPGSLQASGLVAGDSVYLSVSGGSGDYSSEVDKAELLTEIRATSRYRVARNTNETVKIKITDSKTGESKDVVLTIVQKGD